MTRIIMAFIGWIIRRGVIGEVVARILLSLGISYVSYKGLDVGLSSLKSLVVSNVGAAGAQALAAASAMQIGKCISVLFSALATRMAIQGMVNGTIKKMRFK